MATRDTNPPRYRTYDPSLLVGDRETKGGLSHPDDDEASWPPGGPLYSSFDPEVFAAEQEQFEDPDVRQGGPLDSAVRFLTWVVLAVCLVLWAVVGFALWIPLLIRTILAFSFALSRSMLAGGRPDEAGRLVLDAVGFYRRGFSVAVTSILGNPPDEADDGEDGNQSRLSVGDFLFEVVWAAIVWYAVLAAVGLVDTSPVDLWNGAVDLVTNGLERLDHLLTGGSSAAEPARPGATGEAGASGAAPAPVPVQPATDPPPR